MNTVMRVKFGLVLKLWMWLWLGPKTCVETYQELRMQQKTAILSLNQALLLGSCPPGVCLILEPEMACSCKSLQELAKQGFSDLTGIDYSEAAIDLACNLVVRAGFSVIKFLVADDLDAKMDRKYQLVMDKGTLDAIGLHPDGPVKRMMYWESVANLVAFGGLLVITSCNNTKDELLQEVDNFNKRFGTQDQGREGGSEPADVFRYVDYVRTFPTIIFGGVEGSHVSTVAFVCN